ncbi:ribosome biogenesis factor YjgA [Brachymonas sp. G13]|uniref:ribosome biogenesis factor YjgA n=1 Tax=Brachymonas wangyanguii TaxID=3130163 RepID=UPI00307CDAE4
MSRKPKRGYYVRGQFVAEGSEMDLELKRQAKGDTDTSKTDLKRESEALQQLGQELLTLRAGLLNPLELPDRLLEALKEYKRITNFEGGRRQMQYIGKLMRQLDEEDVAAIRAALQVQREGSASEIALLHQAEHWRDRLLDAGTHDAALSEWLLQYPDTDIQQLRALVRQARKDAEAAAKQPAGAAPRQARAYRELFQLLKAQMTTAVEPDAAPGEPEADQE